MPDVTLNSLFREQKERLNSLGAAEVQCLRLGQRHPFVRFSSPQTCYTVTGRSFANVPTKVYICLSQYLSVYRLNRNV